MQNQSLNHFYISSPKRKEKQEKSRNKLKTRVVVDLVVV